MMKKRNMIFPGFMGMTMKWLTAVILIFAVVSCESDDDTQPRDPGEYADGVFVLNEGSMGNANASVSFIPAAGDTVQGNLYKNTNDDKVVGDVLMDMVSVDTLSFLVLNNSQSLMVVNNKNFEHVAEISEGISNPRYAAAHDDMIYVSQWGNGGEILVVDSKQLEVVNSIEVDAGPEGLAIVNDELWVANSGGYGPNNTVSVIDLNQETVKETLEVNDGPKNMVEDANGDVWVVCAGYTEYDPETYEVVSSTPAALHKFDPASYEATETFSPDEGVHGKPGKIALSADKQSIYFNGEGIWKMDVDAAELPSETFVNVSPYGMSVDPDNGDVYFGIAPNFEEAGYVEVYDANGNEVATYEENIGIGPNNFYFTDKK
ncbi:MAG: YncE family protein [Bacteroidota bacterium]